MARGNLSVIAARVVIGRWLNEWSTETQSDTSLSPDDA
jgi:hypothetical protein